jgi:phage terminase large subunit-like protein
LTEEEFQALDRKHQEEYLNLITYRKSRKLLYYVPLPKIKSFHESKAYTRAIFGGNRSGKTTAGGHEFLFHLTGLYPKWYPEANKMKQPIKGRIAGKDFQKGVGEVIIPFLEENLDESIIRRKIRNPIGIATKWILKNGSQFDILTYEQSTEQYEGWRGHIAWFDEPPPRDKYIATLRGLVDFMGRNWLTLTPLTEPWIYDDIYTRQDPNTHVVTTDIRDNHTLSEAAILEFEKSMTEEEKEARLHGRFLHLSGLIYKEFNPTIHICEPPKLPKSSTRFFAIDPHDRTPTACMWLAVDPKGYMWIYDELWLENMDLEQIAHAIHVQEGENIPRIRLIDPHMDKEDALAGGFNVRKELMKHGVYCQRANSDPQLGKSRVKHALKPKYSPVLKTETPLLRVSRHCTQTIYEFQHYIWDDYKKNKDGLTPKQTVKKKNDHFMDCLRYIFNFDPRYVPPDESEDGAEVRWQGEYTKYPTKQPAGNTSYHDLVEKGGPGQF